MKGGVCSKEVRRKKMLSLIRKEFLSVKTELLLEMLTLVKLLNC